MSSRPIVSVIIPTRHRPESLARAVGSVFRQDYPGEIECIVVHDRTPRVDVPVPDAAGRQLVLVDNERGPGVSGARNTGILRARGDFVALCDDDDEWLPAKVRLQVDRLERDGAHWATCGATYHVGRRSFVRLPRAQVTHDDVVRSAVACIRPSCWMLRRSSVGQVGLMDEAFESAEDQDWMLRATHLGPVEGVTEPLAILNLHFGSWFATNWERRMAGIDRLVATHAEFAEVPRRLAQLKAASAFSCAAAGRRREARRRALEALRIDRRQPFACLALLVSLGLPAVWVRRAMWVTGRGL